MTHTPRTPEASAPDFLWRIEHGPAYAVPAALTTEFQDVSWHNDTCPSFCLVSDQEARVRLWCEHPDPELRESSGPRYVVGDSETGDLFIATEELDPAIAMLRAKGVK